MKSHLTEIRQSIIATARALNEYRHDAERLHRALENLAAAERLELDVRTARHDVREYSDLCSRWWGDLRCLAMAVSQELPELYPQLRAVVAGRNTPWHDEPGFDWNAAESELQRIEAAALVQPNPAADDAYYPARHYNAKKITNDDLRNAKRKGHIAVRAPHTPGNPTGQNQYRDADVRGMWPHKFSGKRD